MNILVLEDRGSVSFYMEEALRNEGHIIFSAYNVNDAQSYWEKENIDCIIVDLNMAPDGLKPEEIADTKDGLLTGWIWLSNYVFKDKPEMKRQTVIYTEYMGDLRENVSSQALEGIRLIPKRGFTSTAEQVFNHVKAIALMVERRN
jgi:hypothetical protein